MAGVENMLPKFNINSSRRNFKTYIFAPFESGLTTDTFSSKTASPSWILGKLSVSGAMFTRICSDV